MRVVTDLDIRKMNELYLQLHTYAAVARATGFSPATVKKYIINGFSVVDESKIQRFEGSLPDFDPKPFRTDDWGPLCVLSPEEEKEIQELWKEIEV
jgi:hypothetical protein